MIRIWVFSGVSFVPKKSVESDDPVLGRIIRTLVERRHACGVWRRSGEEASEKGRGRSGEGGGAHQEPILGVDLGGEGPKKRIDAKGWISGDAPMAAGDGGPIPAGKSSSEAWGGVEEVRDKGVEVLAEGIDERRPEMAGAPV